MRSLIDKLAQEFDVFPFNRQIKLTPLQLFALRNIFSNSRNTNDLIRLIPNGKGSIPYPTNHPIRVNNPVLNLVIAPDLSRQSGQHPLLIFGVDAFNKGKGGGIQTGGGSSPDWLGGFVDV